MLTNSNEPPLGRLKHTSNETCDSCEKAKLQLRVRQSEDGREYEYLYCPLCQFEKRPKRSKADGKWKKERDSFPDDIVIVDSKKSLDKRRK